MRYQFQASQLASFPLLLLSLLSLLRSAAAAATAAVALLAIVVVVAVTLILLLFPYSFAFFFFFSSPLSPSHSGLYASSHNFRSSSHSPPTFLLSRFILVSCFFLS